MNVEPLWSLSDIYTEIDRWEQELVTNGKARNTVTTYIQGALRLVRRLEMQSAQSAEGPMATVPSHPTSGGPNRSKYDPLRDHLARRNEPVVELSFRQIESILGFPLPQSAQRYPAWWSNSDGGTHVHARSWTRAMRRTRHVDLNAGTVQFVLG